MEQVDTSSDREPSETDRDERLASIQRACLLAVVAGLPLIFIDDWLHAAYDVPKLALLVAGVGCSAALGIARLGFGRRLWGARAIAVPALALTIPLVVAWIWSPYQEWAAFGQFERFNGVVPYLLFSILAFLLVDAFRRRPNHLAWALAVPGAIVGLYAFLQALGLDPIWSPGEGGASEFPPSSVGHFNFAGGYMAITLPVSIYLWAKSDRGRLGAACTVANVLGLIMANSQGGWVAAMAGVAVIVGALIAEHRPSFLNIGRLAAGAIAVLILLAVPLSIRAEPVSRLGVTVQTRGYLWETALEMGATSPVVGRGPAAYSLEGVRYRPLPSVLLEQHTKADDPHSVPLSFWANAGILGVVGVGWLVVWIFHRARRTGPPNYLGAAFFASCVAYLVQSLVSLDLLTMRMGLWAAMAGLAITTYVGPEPDEPTGRTSASGPMRVVVALVSVAIAGAGIWFATGLLGADRAAEEGEDHFAAGRVDESLERFEAATAFRFEPRYLDLRTRYLGIAALNQGLPEGRPLIEEVKRVTQYLEETPETYSLLGAARVHHYWAFFDEEGDRDAIALLERARPLDPENPEIDVRLAESYLGLGDVEEARAILEPWESRLRGETPGFWAILSIARLIDGDTADAVAALQHAASIQPNDCRVIVAYAFYSHFPDKPLSESAGVNIQVNCGLADFRYVTELLDDFGDPAV